MKIAFLGLGAMGYPMAGHLADKTSHQVVVYNRTVSKAKKWASEHNGQAVSLPQAITHSDVILMCLGRDEDVLSIVESADFIKNLKKGAIIVDHTTTSYQLTQKLLRRFTVDNIDFVDAPISGGQDGAIQGLLSAMMGGETPIIENIKPLLQTYCKTQIHIGSVGSGQLAKMANQICIAGVLSGLSEAIQFAEAQQIDTNKLLSAISGGAAQSWQMVNRGSMMHHRDFDFGFALEWFIKDLGYCLDQAKTTDSDLSSTAVAFEKFIELAKRGYNREDTSALIRWYDK
ncbi:MAG: NAD(P)-dependent oxidoreductase [Ostreibacterium sp.]